MYVTGLSYVMSTSMIDLTNIISSIYEVRFGLVCIDTPILYYIGAPYLTQHSNNIRVIPFTRNS